METYVIVSTVTDKPLATKTSEHLEQAGIPVMIEHVEIVDEDHRAHGFRILVPKQHSQRALMIAESMMAEAIKSDSKPENVAA